MAPKTISDAELIAAGVGARVLVWDNELDDTVTATVLAYDSRGWPGWVVSIDAGQYGEGSVARRVEMQQGPYTESGRFRIVEVVAVRWVSPVVRGYGDPIDDEVVA